MKTAIVPIHFVTFYSLFTKLEKRFPAVTVFDDFLTVMINSFMPSGYHFPELAAFAKYQPHEDDIFRSMGLEYIRIYRERVDSGAPWYDGFANFTRCSEADRMIRRRV
jgi:hypothetical protein